jgi:hypothetical protein
MADWLRMFILFFETVSEARVVVLGRPFLWPRLAAGTVACCPTLFAVNGTVRRTEVGRMVTLLRQKLYCGPSKASPNDG